MRQRLKKSLKIALSSVVLAGCSQSPVYCHTWNPGEKVQIIQSIDKLPDDNILIPVLEDYQGVCKLLRNVIV